MQEIDHKARAHALLSASSSHRWLACPKSAAAESTYPEATSTFAEEGTLAHEFAELFARGLADGTGSRPTAAKIQALTDKFDPERNYFSKEMLDCAEAYRNYIEEQLESDDAVVIIEQRVDFSKWVPEGFGTGDCIILANKKMKFIDYKFGKGVEVSAVDNPQLKCYGLGAINDYGSLYEVEEVELCIFQPRINNVSEWSIPAAELLKWADEVLKPTAELAARGAGEYHAGPHCQFCKHAGACRELAKSCCHIVRLNGERVKVDNLTGWEIKEIIENTSMVKKWLESVSAAALARLINGEQIEGLKLVEGRSSRDWTNPAEVQTILEEKQIDASKYMTAPELLSVSQLEKSLGKKKVAELLVDKIKKTPGKITITNSEDKRPEYKPGGDFEIIDDTRKGE